MPVEDEQILERIDALWANNIPVVTFNTDTPGSRRLCYVGQDNYLSGRACAGLMNMLLGGQGKVLMLSGHFSSFSHRRRIDGFQSEVHSLYPGLTLLPLERGNDDRQICYDCVHVCLMNMMMSGASIWPPTDRPASATVCATWADKKKFISSAMTCCGYAARTKDGTIDFVIDQNASMQASVLWKF